jgi:hypothetical protein
MKFSEGITDSLNIYPVEYEYITSFRGMRCTGQHHFEATKQLGGKKNYDIWRYNA